MPDHAMLANGIVGELCTIVIVARYPLTIMRLILQRAQYNILSLCHSFEALFGVASTAKFFEIHS